MSIRVIAEFGSTHGGRPDRLIDLFGAMQRRGTWAVKFQYWSDPDHLAKRRGVPDASAYRPWTLNPYWLPLLAEQAHKVGLQFLCTVYLPEDVETVAPHVDAWKIASFEAMDQDLIARCLAVRKLPMVISTGMMDGPEWLRFLAWLQRLSIEGSADMTLLHCVSAYPTPVTDVNLLRMGSMRRDLQMAGLGIVGVGFSDHTRYFMMGALAAAAGAEMIEVHVKPSWCQDDNPDAPHSLTVEEQPWVEGAFTRYLELIRTAEDALGTGMIFPSPSEAPNRAYRVAV